MYRQLTLIVLAGVMSGCANWLPTCDGSDRRPINTPSHADVAYPSCGGAA